MGLSLMLLIGLALLGFIAIVIVAIAVASSGRRGREKE